MKSIYEWQKSTELADHLGVNFQSVAKFNCDPHTIERMVDEGGQPLFRVSPPAHYRWQTAGGLGEILGLCSSEVQEQCKRYLGESISHKNHHIPVEKRDSDDRTRARFLYRVDPSTGWSPEESDLPCGPYWLEWPGYIDVHDGAVDEVVATYFFHKVEPDEARRLASDMVACMRGEVAA